MEQNSTINRPKSVLSKKWLSEGISIGLITVMGYLCAFCYEAGYFRFYKIPISLIDINITNIFIAVGVVLLLSVSLLLLLTNFIYMFRINLKSPIGIRFLILISYSPFLILFMLISPRTLIYGLTVFFVIFFDLFIFPLISKRQIKGYRQKLEAQGRTTLNYIKKTMFFDKLENIYGKNAIILILLISCFLYGSAVIGHVSAKYDSEFLIIKSGYNIETLVVLKSYSDRLICAPIIEGQKKIKPQFHIVRLDSKEIVLERAKIGPLSLEEEPDKEAMKK